MSRGNTAIGFDMKRFFFTEDAVKRALNKAARRNLSQAGAFVRRDARRSIRSRGRQMPLSDMPKEQRQNFHIRTEIAKREGRPRPRRPLLPSRPGKPPLSRTGLLKRFIFFSYDPQQESVVIGPQRLSTDRTADGNTVPGVLEEGGISRRGGPFIEPRPFMEPAFDKNQDKIADMWRNSVRKN